VTKSEARTLTSLVINHLNAGCLSQLPLPSRKAQLQTLSSHRNGGLLDRVEYLSRVLVMMTTASSNQTSLPAFTSLTSHAVLWRRRSAQPILLGYVVQRRSPRFGAFDEFIRDACHRRGPSIWFELQKIGAAQHPGIERRAIIPAAFQFHCETARYHTACLQRPMVRSPQRRRENCVRFSSESTPSLIGSRWTSVARARSNCLCVPKTLSRFIE
jgi:hypothetical protein